MIFYFYFANTIFAKTTTLIKILIDLTTSNIETTKFLRTQISKILLQISQNKLPSSTILEYLQIINMTTQPVTIKDLLKNKLTIN